ncbi:TetR/AcrR family transcriptional regulator [Gallionella capsiferriformans]|uniref:Transcriptional regulator, TetR family n=1 Tax=Gallionella capsiferriformans (strain ES-2) TaxID=395494 RepID=D9SK74_GALCS|nr:TetR/AcrR family transcriptional regulator [Gallionella capsiferriformans]ADL56486.1 transcriptional regulator, TetR family [Gallionella capsiferriformans ES-2]
MNTEVIKQRLSTEERQKEIVRVAIHLAAEKGIDSVTTQDMADAMKVTQGAIFKHFPTKDDIWLAVIHWIRGRLMTVLEKAASEATGPIDAIERMFYAHVTFIGKHPSIPRLLFTEMLHKKNSKLRDLIQGIISGYEERIAGLLDAAKTQSLVSQDLDSKNAAVLYIGMIQGLFMQVSIFGGKRSLLEEAKKTFPIYLHGIKKRNEDA